MSLNVHYQGVKSPAGYWHFLRAVLFVGKNKSYDNENQKVRRSYEFSSQTDSCGDVVDGIFVSSFCPSM
jgi:hypothetical protein